MLTQPNRSRSGEAAARDASQALVAMARRPLALMLRYAGYHKLGHITVLISVLAAVACSVCSQYAVKHLVDVLSHHQGGHAGAAVWIAFGLLAALIAADNMTWRIGGWVASHCFVAVSGDLRRDLFQHLTGHAPSYFSVRSPGTLAGRITATGNAIYTIENTLAWNVLPPCVAVLLSIGLLVTVDPVMAAVLIVIAGLLAWLLTRMAAHGRSYHHAYAESAAAVDGELVDVISNLPLVRACGATFRERERFSTQVAREQQARGDSLRYLEKLRLFHAATTAVLTAGLLAWALLLWQSGAASTGDVVLVTTLGFTILHGTRDLAVALVDLVQHVARLAEALATLLVPHELTDAPGAKTLHPCGGAVAFKGVGYAYPDGRRVLEDFDLTIAAGQRIGLVGRSGAGKSTVLALLQRLRDVGEGAITIDGLNIADMTLDSLRAAMSVVPQDVFLFHRTVMENIRYGRPDASEADVRAAAKAAGCLEFIEAMPEGFDTLVGDRGVKLSGGQRQRLAIARAFLRDAPILVLDEATSALDSESEQVVQEALDRLMTGRTVIAVAHRLSTLRDFDRIVVMADGRIVDDGTPAELERRPGPYQELLGRQGLRLVQARAA
jgi:ATP-binding cassette subfamily B protein